MGHGELTAVVDAGPLIHLFEIGCLQFLNHFDALYLPDAVWGETRGMDVKAAEDLLAALDAAEALSDLSPLRSVGLHKLKGERAGQWAMTINGPWRICFRFRNGNAYDVQITNYHKG